MLDSLLSKVVGSVDALKGAIAASENPEEIEQLQVVKSRGQGICDVIKSEMSRMEQRDISELETHVGNYVQAVNRFTAAVGAL